MRLNNKSHLLKTGLTTIQRNYSIINLLKSFYRLANLNLKFGAFVKFATFGAICRTKKALLWYHQDLKVRHQILPFKNNKIV